VKPADGCWLSDESKEPPAGFISGFRFNRKRQPEAESLSAIIKLSGNLLWSLSTVND